MNSSRMNSSPRGDLLLGTASGLAAGFVGAMAMTAFQSALARGRITSGVSGAPSTEKAADRAARLATGRPVPRDRRAAAGDAVHNGFGALLGGLYGAAAEVEPRVTAGRGAAFGVAAATAVDETMVPVLRLGAPAWKAPWRSHPYSYVSHLVFGLVVEAARRVFRRFLGDVKAGAAVAMQPTEARAAAVATLQPARPPQRTLALAFLLGAFAGPRTAAPLAITSWAAWLGWIDLKGSPLAFLGTAKAITVTTPLAIGELVADKLPSTPSRTQPVGVLARTVSGAASGAALAGGRSPSAALAGAAGAVAATYLGHAVRLRMARALGRDRPVAVVEDLLAYAGATMVCLAALAPTRSRRPGGQGARALPSGLVTPAASPAGSPTVTSGAAIE